MTQPRVDVIIPSYNREKSIIASVESVLQQTYKHIHVYIIDDGSEDNTERKIRELNNEKITYYKNHVNMGANASRNKGIEISVADYIAFQDSDDVWSIDKLEKQMAVMQENKEVDVVYCDFYHCKPEGSRLFLGERITTYDKNEGIRKTLLNRNIVTTSTMLVKRKCFEEVGGFDETLPRLQDWELCLRLSERYKFRCVSEGLVSLYSSNNSISSDLMKYSRAMSYICLRYKLQMQKEGVWEENIRKIAFKILGEGDGKNEIEECFNTVYEVLPEEDLKNAGIHKAFVTYMINLKKNKDYYEVGCDWLEGLIRENRLSDFFVRRECHKIGIYGAGKYGILLKQQLIREDRIEIACFIEKSEIDTNDIDGIKVLNISKIKKEDLEMLGAIVVTPVFEFEKIKKELSEKFKGEIISIKDIVRQADK